MIYENELMEILSEPSLIRWSKNKDAWQTYDERFILDPVRSRPDSSYLLWVNELDGDGIPIDSGSEGYYVDHDGNRVRRDPNRYYFTIEAALELIARIRVH